MRSLFDPVEDIKLPDERPPRNWGKVLKIAGIIVGAVVLIGGGWYSYESLRPKKLTEKPVPQSPEMLMKELTQAREAIDSSTRDIHARLQQFNAKMEMLGRQQISFAKVFVQGLSAEEEAALDKMVKEEKDPSYKGVLSQVVEDMKTIRDLQTKVTDLESKLPGDGIDVQPGDTHLNLAKKFLMDNHH